MILYVRPSRPGFNPADATICYIVHLADLFLRMCAEGKHTADIPHIVIRELRARRPFTPWRIASPFRRHIGQIFGLCAKKKMAGIHAQRHVAGMANKEPVGDRAVVYLPRGSVRPVRLPSTTPVDTELPITSSLSTGFPYPASARAVFVNFFDESLFKCFHRSTMAENAGHGNSGNAL